jgi:hypothetical protein
MRIAFDDVRRARLNRLPLFVLSALSIAGLFLAMRVPAIEPWIAPPRMPLLVLAAASLLASIAAWQTGRRTQQWTTVDDVAWVIALGVFGALAGAPSAPLGLGTVLHTAGLLLLALRDPSPSLVVIASATAAMVPVLRALLQPIPYALVPSLVMWGVATAAFTALTTQTRKLARLWAERDAWASAHARIQAANVQPAAVTRTPRVSLASAQSPTRADERAATEGPEHGWDALVERVRIALTGMAESAGVSAKVQAELHGLAPPTTKMRTNLLRIAQEAMTQTIRVAEPRSIEVTLRRGDGGVVFELTDDGALGHEARQRRSLAPLRGRVAAMGGTAEIKRGEHGWVTRVKLPAEQLN